MNKGVGYGMEAKLLQYRPSAALLFSFIFWVSFNWIVFQMSVATQHYLPSGKLWTSTLTLYILMSPILAT